VRVFDLNVACRPGAALTPLAGTFAQLAGVANTSTLPLHTCVGPCPQGEVAIQLGNKRHAVGKPLQGLPSEVIQIDPLVGGSHFLRCGGSARSRR
jgi:hypothetical protein